MELRPYYQKAIQLIHTGIWQAGHKDLTLVPCPRMQGKTNCIYKIAEKLLAQNSGRKRKSILILAHRVSLKSSRQIKKLRSSKCTKEKAENQYKCLINLCGN